VIDHSHCDVIATARGELIDVDAAHLRLIDSFVNQQFNI
jgi:hypothetical protein